MLTRKTMLAPAQHQLITRSIEEFCSVNTLPSLIELSSLNMVYRQIQANMLPVYMVAARKGRCSGFIADTETNQGIQMNPKTSAASLPPTSSLMPRGQMSLGNSRPSTE